MTKRCALYVVRKGLTILFIGEFTHAGGLALFGSRNFIRVAVLGAQLGKLKRNGMRCVVLTGLGKKACCIHSGNSGDNPCAVLVTKSCALYVKLKGLTVLFIGISTYTGGLALLRRRDSIRVTIRFAQLGKLKRNGVRRVVLTGLGKKACCIHGRSSGDNPFAILVIERIKHLGHKSLTAAFMLTNAILAAGLCASGIVSLFFAVFMAAQQYNVLCDAIGPVCMQRVHIKADLSIISMVADHSGSEFQDLGGCALIRPSLIRKTAPSELLGSDSHKAIGNRFVQNNAININLQHCGIKDELNT